MQGIVRNKPEEFLPQFIASAKIKHIMEGQRSLPLLVSPIGHQSNNRKKPVLFPEVVQKFPIVFIIGVLVP
ncbi:MAG: hypothetical protein K2O06_16270 [Acetatifactor sp.]|nr:hypothetical protein [Acetatifactor sp.]